MKTNTKTKKSTTKNSKKTAQLVVDFRNINDVNDVLIATMFAKVNQGKTIAAEELDALITKVAEITVEEIFGAGNAAVLNLDGSIERLTAVPYKEKKNIFKRFLSWIKHPFKKC